MSGRYDDGELMSAKKPSRPWRLAIPSPDGPVYKPHRSESAVLDAVAQEKKDTDARQITIESWADGRWTVWLRWVQTGTNWHAE
ncbi:hypothetical protein [Streptomyces sp. CC224B]|uniref:hypothetical protein n=1 Tax=Streptomyces sp. CC224B TaxID=3044571 RepID=UPI0024A99F3B|nr:hypothetical protein [Streptomyces sp. CC224B]